MRQNSLPQGNEQTVGGVVLDEALKLVGSSTKSVRRSTGGLVLAEPYQLIVFGEPGETKPDSAVRIRVRFRDFKRVGNRVVSAEYVTHTKTVLPEDLHEPFALNYRGEGSQRYLLDFGDGTVPVYVFHIESQEGNSGSTAYFIELADLERLRHGRPGAKVRVAAHQVSPDVLRFAADDPMRGPYEYQLAIGNYLRLRQDGRRVVPEVLQVGVPLTAPAGLGAEDTRRCLAADLARVLQPEIQPCYTLDEDEGGLEPFGSFEP